MGKASLPDGEKKRRLLYDKRLSPDELVRFGDMYFKEARYVEAAEFYRKAAHADGMERLRSLAKDEGDSFLFELATKGSSDGQAQRDWEELGKKALTLKKYSHAVRAFRKAGSVSLLEEAELAFKGAVHRGKT